jgi:hypothetical protein
MSRKLLIQTDKRTEKVSLIADVGTQERAEEIARGRVKGAGQFTKNSFGDHANKDIKVEIFDKSDIAEVYKETGKMPWRTDE